MIGPRLAQWMRRVTDWNLSDHDTPAQARAHRLVVLGVLGLAIGALAIPLGGARWWSPAWRLGGAALLWNAALALVAVERQWAAITRAGFTASRRARQWIVRHPILTGLIALVGHVATTLSSEGRMLLESSALPLRLLVYLLLLLCALPWWLGLWYAGPLARRARDARAATRPRREPAPALPQAPWWEPLRTIWRRRPRPVR